MPRLDLKTRVCLVVHFQELKRTTNTGRLAIHALKNSEMRVRGEIKEGLEALDLSDLLKPEYHTVLFYPSEDAEDLNAEFLAKDPRPIQLIVPDGNWRQASKVHIRHQELKNIPRVKISAINTSEHHMRRETRPEGMATLQAIAEALAVIEGEEVGDQMRALYQLKLHRTLQGRGLLPKC